MIPVQAGVLVLVIISIGVALVTFLVSVLLPMRLGARALERQGPI